MASTLSFEQIKKQYLRVFLALMVLTAVTVSVSFIHIGGWIAIVVGIAIALVKGGLVASIFMHLRFENRRLRYFVYVPVLFFLILVLTLTKLGL
jgi:cytochrome c oxidase subunit IV